MARLLLPLLLAGLGLGPAPAYRLGDLFLLSPAIPYTDYGLTGWGPGLVRIDPLSGQTTLELVPEGLPNHFNLSYDPTRDSLIFGAVISGVGDLWALDASGVASGFGVGMRFGQFTAPTGDGRIYWWSDLKEYHYLDSQGVDHLLLDSTGTTPFTIFDPVHALAYHRPTNSLFVLTWSGFAIGCNPTSLLASIRRIPLSADGSQVSGTIDCVEVEVSLTSGEAPVGMTPRPNGDYLLVFDTNSNAQEPRMMLLDPFTLAVTPYASNGSYTGAAATNAGAWVGVRQKAAILDTFHDCVRLFGAGQVGQGSILATSGLSTSGGTNEWAWLTAITGRQWKVIQK